jgi:oligopeptide/dipeptide ABC transporter ATP-binding protein
VPPDLLIADEPTTGLDATVQMQILTLLASLQQRLGLTILLITHDIGVVSHFAHHIAVLYAGELGEHGAVEPVLDAPRHPYTRALLQAVPELARAGGTSRLRSIAGTVPSLWELAGGCAFRARCGRASPVCATTPPTSVHDEHLVGCHHPWPGQEASL